MHIYDTFIKGAGYSSFGYALERKNTLICESSHLCDPHFYGAFKGFYIEDRVPENPLAKEFYFLCKEQGILQESKLDVSALESALCAFLKDRDYKLLLNTECIEVKPKNGLFKILISSNSGLETVYAKRIFDTTPSETDRKYLAVLCTPVDMDILNTVFDGAAYDTAFYENRMVVYIPEDAGDYNETKASVYDKWKEHIMDSQIISIAPNFAQLFCTGFMYEKDNYMKVSEGIFRSPFEAFEFGIQCGGEIRD